MHKKYNFSEPFISGNEIDYIKDVISNGFFGGNGPYSKRCEELIQQEFGISKVLLTDSCTSALEITALLMALNPDDEIILPSYTFPSTGSAFLRAGAKLVFAEIDAATLMIDAEDVKNKITTKTKAIVAVHYAGTSANLSPLLKLATEYNLKLVEDSAQGFGSFNERGQPLGSIGDFGCISFHETKNIHCGLGGALYINSEDKELISKAVQIWERGTNRQDQLKGLVDKYTWTALGSSFYPSELQSAFLFSQLEVYKSNIEQRSLIYSTYINELRDIESSNKINILKHLDKGHNHHALIIIVESEEVSDQLLAFLRTYKINPFIGYVPLHSSPMGQSLGYNQLDLPVTYEVSKRVIRLPFHNNLSIDDVVFITTKIKNFYE
tara:strand:+ start:2558 stop:3700 length:1143 start_codon:yes stop_codon:yes gene_type:complete